MKRGFTLIEALTVISIVGVLATLTTYVVTSAQRQARDAKRKSDLTALGVGFQARFEDLTCSLTSDLRHYPGYKNIDNSDRWQSVATLNDTSNRDSCGVFSEYLTITPKDPKHDATSPYQFNLSNESGVRGKHFRLGALLERTLTTEQTAELARNNTIWDRNLFGIRYPARYTYFIGD